MYPYFRKPPNEGEFRDVDLFWCYSASYPKKNGLASDGIPSWWNVLMKPGCPRGFEKFKKNMVHSMWNQLEPIMIMTVAMIVVDVLWFITMFLFNKSNCCWFIVNWLAHAHTYKKSYKKHQFISTKKPSWTWSSKIYVPTISSG